MIPRPLHPVNWLIVVAVSLASSSAQAADLTVSVGQVSGAVDSTVSVPVTAQGGPQVEAGRVVLSYDPAVLEVDDVKTGSVPKAGNAVGGFTINEPGRVTMNFVSTEGVAGAGEWFVVQFKVKGSTGQTSPLKIEKVVSFRFDNRVDILADMQDGTFTVSSQLPIETIAMIGGGVLLLITIIAVAKRSGRRPVAVPSYQNGGAITCPGCGKPNSETDQFCGGCGQSLAAGRRSQTCGGCGATLEAGKSFCTKCGARV